MTKGFIAQAKMAGPYKRIKTKRRLDRVEKMLAQTPSSYVFLYRPKGVSAVPAISVAAAGAIEEVVG